MLKLSSKQVHIDSLHEHTSQNQLMSIILVMPTGQHLHAIFQIPTLKLDEASFESMAENM